MDAKPQRPLRAFKVRDENLVLSGTANPIKTIHQRNKSTPVLSTLTQAGAIKAAAKRTAFADVSNTLRPPQPSNDDSTLSTKGASDVVKGPMVQVQDAQKPSALLRPAQRPLSNAAPKSSTENIPVISEETKLAVRRQTVSEANGRSVQPIDNVAKGPGKKSTAVFKDVVEISKPSKANDSAVSITGLAVPVQASLPTRRQKSKTDMRAEAATSEPLSKAVEAPVVSSAIEQCPQEKGQDGGVAVQPLYVDAVESLDQLDTYDSVSLEAQAQLSYLADLEAKATEFDRARHAEVATDPQLPGVLDPEAWVDEDGEPYYEDEYTTARSLRLRSDGNTTGGITMVLNPRVTTRVERDLAIAKEIVESSRTEEDIEDEAWDTSMVAEYGEEIFQYMRSLEVGDDDVHPS
ncbi:MAG: hypothetical protein M1822_001925 [Bathelium mastoideum]|nr:MAG: hypothetical protein M1822_001925 [Bathelium mastoideum]